MNCWIIYDQKQYDHNKWFADRLCEVCGQYFSTTLILAERLTFGVQDGRTVFCYEGRFLPAPEAAVCRTIFPMLSYTLEMCGTRVFNNSTISGICNDKRRTYGLVHSMGLPIMNTVFCDRRFFVPFSGTSRSESPTTALPSDYPVILKTAMGHGGREVFMIHDAAEHSAVVQSLPEDSFLLQKVLVPYGQDLRVFVLGGRIVCATMRTAPSFRSNHALGGVASYYELNADETALVNKIISGLPTVADLIGIDFLPCEGGLIFNEIEDVVGCRMIYETTDIDIAVMYAEYIRAEIAER